MQVSFGVDMSREQKSAHHDLALVPDREGSQHAWEVLDQVFPRENKKPLNWWPSGVHLQTMWMH